MRTEVRARTGSDRAGRIVKALEANGLLLVSDAALPSVASLVAGAPVKGSWWGHPKGRDIWLAIEEIDEHPDILFVKLVSGKVTLVYRRLWPALFATASARASWQTAGLSAQAKRVLAQVDRDGSIRTDGIGGTKGESVKAMQIATRELEERLLVHSEQFHTESGAHARKLESWRRWATRTKLAGPTLSATEGKERLEEALKSLSERHGDAGRLPWQRTAGKRKGPRY